MEYLNRQLQTLKNQSNFNFHPKCGELSITHLPFVDDLLLFSRDDLTLVLILYECFNALSNASSMVANYEKSSVYFRGVSMAEHEAILRSLGFVKADTTKTSLIAWEKFCNPKPAGALGFVDVTGIKLQFTNIYGTFA
ncbi:hypothetical protein H5410_047101 [Solanum commersonii]|uniref:Reverse transcriptase domain-containing protein n=1 Tax=Solanum commersonii TaxID=4109 RepID=A0A9J5XE63_SOLCO|nr:hypothetical protein H5410_047101 [Solanum commersonii]